MSRKRIILAVSAGLLLLVAGLGLHSQQQSGPVSDGKEPEAEGLRIVRFSGDTKLSSLLATPQLGAAKSEMSNYIRSQYGPRIYTAVITDTVIQNDGSIAVEVDIGEGRTFRAIIQNGADQFIFSVPAAKYQTSTPQSAILNQFSGFN